MVERARIGRNASNSTQAILNSLPDETSPNEALIKRMQDMFCSPNKHAGYLKSKKFSDDLITLNMEVQGILEKEPRCVFLQSPAHVFGDIRGNLEDLHFLSDNIWNLGMALAAGKFVFLGDYVDRGMSGLEVVAYLLAMKLMLPQKVFLLRRNHETRAINGWEDHYGPRSFIVRNGSGRPLATRCGSSPTRRSIVCPSPPSSIRISSASMEAYPVRSRTRPWRVVGSRTY